MERNLLDRIADRLGYARIEDLPRRDRGGYLGFDALFGLGPELSTADTLAAERDLKRRDPEGYFRILRLHPDSFKGLDEEQALSLVGAVYRVMASIYHPDKGGNPKLMSRLNQAKDVLSDPSKRREYTQRAARSSGIF